MRMSAIGKRSLGVTVGFACFVLAGAWLQAARPATPQASARASGAAPESAASPQRALVDQYCVTCHNERQKTAGLSLAAEDMTEVGANAEVWEKVVRKLRGGAMPPARRPRPDEQTLDAFRVWLETELDSAALADPHPGRTEAFHRLNRTEYRNAIRDLLAIEGINFDLMLPADDLSYGFDNIAGVLKLSPSLLERYLSAARKVSLVAVGTGDLAPDNTIYRVRDDLAQWDRFEDLPFGTRGGTLVRHYFPTDADYVVRATVDGNSGKIRPHQLEVTVDGEPVGAFTLTGGEGKTYGMELDSFDVRLPIKAGLREVAATFVKITSAEVQGLVEPYDRPQEYRPLMPFLRSVTIMGPFQPTVTEDTPSRRRVFVCRPESASEEEPCARQIFSTLARRAYRRPVGPDDVAWLMPFYETGYAEGGFDQGIARGIERILMSPWFLFRVEEDPADVAPNVPYRISDLELASRLSFFLWSSVPDDELLEVAEQGRLRDPAVLEHQVKRMLASPRTEALATNFAGQWLQLRNLPAALPDSRAFPRFDDGLRQSFRRETELLVESLLRENASALGLLSANYTFLNERLARHYGVPDVYGSHFRRVAIQEDARRGLLGQGSVLTVTSYATRTSPVVRGKWILENLLGTPPPPPPPAVEALVEKKETGEALSMREAMSLHRSNPSCASCHALMDPLGFALENFDATGHWRDRGEANEPIDASGALPNGTEFEGVVGLRQVLLSQPEQFVSTLTEKLLTYALGRGVDYHDMPAIRRIVRDAEPEGYKLSSLVLGIINSPPFQMRRSES